MKRTAPLAHSCRETPIKFYQSGISSGIDASVILRDIPSKLTQTVRGNPVRLPNVFGALLSL